MLKVILVTHFALVFKVELSLAKVFSKVSMVKDSLVKDLPAMVSLDKDALDMFYLEKDSLDRSSLDKFCLVKPMVQCMFPQQFLQKMEVRFLVSLV